MTDEEWIVWDNYLADQLDNLRMNKQPLTLEQWAIEGIKDPAPLIAWYEQQPAGAK